MIAQLVRKAENAGFKAIALTLDTPRLGQREADIRNKYGIENYKDVNNVPQKLVLKIELRYCVSTIIKETYSNLL